ncbi:uncharacterized protein LOC105164351 isoform X2 [Sesamum indicum]|uniref:Uncharacterized protein LOC105164351 isoform X2 n=1 Tax=Sesamum indicum TaxID=4182 RepID=A0A8M8UTD1_SESIN|nr:uncharacterized protein LOC105164351 isoform X2 [Sesamum indicum]
MAVPPVKSQPLHNFSLPHLKWPHKNSSSSASGSTSLQHRLRHHDSPDQRHHCYPDAGCNLESGPTTASQSNSLVWEEDDDNEAARPWNLRPRKEVIKAAWNLDKGTRDGNNYNKTIRSSNGVKSQRLSGLLEGGKLSGGVERKEKRKVWISLSREEIEEDVYALTGGKPARRPRRWPKNVQKQLDV